MNKSTNFLNGNTFRQKRLLLAAAVLLSILTLTYCHSKSAPDGDAGNDADTDTTTVGVSTADTDGDGVPGNLDACPDKAGAALDNGCPVDSDGDGIVDLDDQCPIRAGEIDGCPEDSDKDGVAHIADNCPDSAGTVANQGCPTDSDGDGVGDAIDRCPQTAGQSSLDGCAPESATTSDDANKSLEESSADPNEEVAQQSTSDADGDGITGEFDKCPAQFGDATDNGCPPDSDNDGIADIDDRCPSVAGTADAAGCVTNSTSDDRVVLDKQDQQILDDALAEVAFDSNSATLTAESRDLLANVAGLLRKYPTATLEIRGHTDASGIADNNMQLSMARARSAAAYIVSAGIDVNRIQAFGFGESQPIADNNSVAGRRKNRRVEFDLLFNQ